MIIFQFCHEIIFCYVSGVVEFSGYTWLMRLIFNVQSEGLQFIRAQSPPVWSLPPNFQPTCLIWLQLNWTDSRLSLSISPKSWNSWSDIKRLTCIHLGLNKRGKLPLLHLQSISRICGFGWMSLFKISASLHWPMLEL